MLQVKTRLAARGSQPSSRPNIAQPASRAPSNRHRLESWIAILEIKGDDAIRILPGPEPWTWTVEITRQPGDP